MSDAVTLDRVFVLAKQLPLAEKVRLIEWIAPQIERELLFSQQRGSRKSLRGLWRGLGIAESDIHEARRETYTAICGGVS
jgi:hypothetical protein